jgi:hypothetical protein
LRRRRRRPRSSLCARESWRSKNRKQRDQTRQ